ncbi:hypothetical protein KO465_08835 [Candidatus Micrarchaeota archaeon]|jgi:hypothetical protein|nr:hypothetical protein [Candidatus Micrarchaeota archaeon]
MNDVDMVSQLGDMKEIDYRNTLAIASLIELLIDKGILDRHEIAKKARLLDDMTAQEIAYLNKKKSI